MQIIRALNASYPLRSQVMGPDLNLLVALDVLLEEGSVARAAQRLRLSPSAMSRTLARLRDATGDPLLVRAGRGLVPTPRALELRTRAPAVVQDAQSILRPAEVLDLSRLTRTFTLRTSEGFVENFGPQLVARAAEAAPEVRLRFAVKPDRDASALRDGGIDLETGVVGSGMGPEVRVQTLFRDRFVGVTRSGHPLAKGRMTASRYAAESHVLVSRGGADAGPVDAALAAVRLNRRIAVVVGGFSAALAMVRASDLVAAVPERHTGNLRMGLFSFALPVALAPITVSLMWHPRLDADAAHKWLRSLVRDVCR